MTRSRWGRRLVAGAIGLVVVLAAVYGAARLQELADQVACER